MAKVSSAVTSVSAMGWETVRDQLIREQAEKLSVKQPTVEDEQPE
jgi:hypothetical protein